MEIELTKGEMLMGVISGFYRIYDSTVDNQRMMYRKTHQRWGENIEGSLAELAFSKFINRYFVMSMRDDGYDVHTFQVRSSAAKNCHLLLKDKDEDEHTFVLLEGEYGKYKIVGALKGIDGKKKEYAKKDSKGKTTYYMVPQSKLKPFKLNGK